jgi:hypothetical protein
MLAVSDTFRKLQDADHMSSPLPVFIQALLAA